MRDAESMRYMIKITRLEMMNAWQAQQLEGQRLNTFFGIRAISLIKSQLHC